MPGPPSTWTLLPTKLADVAATGEEAPVAQCAPSSTLSTKSASCLQGNDGPCSYSYSWVKLIPTVSVAPGQMIAKRTFTVGPVAIITVYINVIQTYHLGLHKR